MNTTESIHEYIHEHIDEKLLIITDKGYHHYLCVTQLNLHLVQVH